MSDILIAEISGKRPGTVKQRPTEKFFTGHDKVIISNNSEGYETDWNIINVPEDYAEYYKAHVKNSENAWYAPMNRSYAVKYAKEHGYRYLVQLDDNIIFLEIGYQYKTSDGITKRYRTQSRTDMLDDFIDMMICVLKNTNAGMAGCALAGVANPDSSFLTERYVYSIFALDLSRVPDEFQGDFEDDVEYRLKLAQMGVPVVQISPFRYSKTGQAKNKDLSGCRKAYSDAGIKRGEHMIKLYGDVYSCGMRSRKNGIRAEIEEGEAYFKHKLKPFKIGVVVNDYHAIVERLQEILKKYSTHKEDKTIIKEKKIRR